MWRRLVMGRPVVDEAFGWASASLPASIERAVLLGMAVWQLPMVVTIVAQPELSSALAWLLAGHLALGVVAVRVAGGRWPAEMVVAGAFALFVIDWALVDSVEDPLLLAACWQMNLAGTLPAVLLRGGRAWVASGCAVIVVPAAMVLVRPGFEGGLPGSVLVTALAIAVATRIGLSFVYDLTRDADVQDREAADQQVTAEARRAAAERAAEDARILHDTVINTLGALANGGAAVADVDVVRDRCRRDLAAMAVLTDARDEPAPLPGDSAGHAADPPPDHLLRDLLADTIGAGITVRRAGVDDAALRRLEAELPTDVLDALARAVGELVRNAAKHAGVGEVTVEVRGAASDLTIAVADAGVGFTGEVPRGRGLATSVFARLESARVAATLDTAPGRGTRVTLRYPAAADAAEAPTGEPAFDQTVRALQRRAAAMFASGLCGVGVLLAFSNHYGRLNEEHAMVAVVAAACLLAWWRPRPMAAWLPLLLIVSAASAFVLSAAAVDFGRHDVVRWQAICPAGPLIFLLSSRAGRRWVGLGVTTYAGTVLTVAATVADTFDSALSVVVAGLAGWGLVSGWVGFHRTLTRLGRHGAAAQQAAQRLRLESAAREAALTARRRWGAAGLASATDLLRRVAVDADPADEDLRRACSEEEAYLRQLTQLHPDLIQMGEWFARALAEARAQGVGLTVRSGSTDVDAAVADRLGALMLDAVDAVPGGQRLNATLLPSASGAHFTIVGPHPLLASVTTRFGANESIRLRAQTLGTQDVIEVAVGATAPASADPPPAAPRSTTSAPASVSPLMEAVSR